MWIRRIDNYSDSFTLKVIATASLHISIDFTIWMLAIFFTQIILNFVNMMIVGIWIMASHSIEEKKMKNEQWAINNFI